MINCEQDLLVNLIELSPRNARRKFRQSIFESWEWKCAYCDKDLDEKSATIDHILPKFKGGHNVKSNMICSCSKCNRSKGLYYWKIGIILLILNSQRKDLVK